MNSYEQWRHMNTSPRRKTTFSWQNCKWTQCPHWSHWPQLTIFKYGLLSKFGGDILLHTQHVSESSISESSSVSVSVSVFRLSIWMQLVDGIGLAIALMVLMVEFWFNKGCTGVSFSLFFWSRCIIWCARAAGLLFRCKLLLKILFYCISSSLHCLDLQHWRHVTKWLTWEKSLWGYRVYVEWVYARFFESWHNATSYLEITVPICSFMYAAHSL